MLPQMIRATVAGFLALVVGASSGAAQHAPAPADDAAVLRARADSARLPYTPADIRFMTLMIGHHAQALEMARLAPTHGASPAVQTLAARILNGQQDEIVTMQRWLRDRRQPVPDVADGHAGHAMPAGDSHAAHGASHGDHDAAAMPGMLTPAQMQELDAARGTEFDALFLRYMIQHHRGAVTMVKELFATYGAGQDETVFRFATDVNVDQMTEIQRMETMLADILFAPDA